MRHALFAERLVLAQQLLANPERSADLPVQHLDQLRAAAREAHGFAHDAGAFLKAVAPSRGWRNIERAVPTPEQHAYLLAALLGCILCPHLRKEGPQPVIASLPLARMDCRRCAQTRRMPRPGSDDQCDVCGEHGISWFTPFSVAMGPVLASGDACSRCAAALLPREEAA